MHLPSLKGHVHTVKFQAWQLHLKTGVNPLKYCSMCVWNTAHSRICQIHMFSDFKQITNYSGAVFLLISEICFTKHVLDLWVWNKVFLLDFRRQCSQVLLALALQPKLITAVPANGTHTRTPSHLVAFCPTHTQSPSQTSMHTNVLYADQLTCKQNEKNMYKCLWSCLIKQSSSWICQCFDLISKIKHLDLFRFIISLFLF